MKTKEKDFIELTLRKIDNSNNFLWKEDLDLLSLVNSVRFPIERLFESYSSRKKMDFLSHLRQVCVYMHGKIRVPDNALAWAKSYKTKFGFDIDYETNSVSAKPNVMLEYDDLKHSYTFLKKRKHIPSFPDPALHNVFGFNSYISLQQKMMIYTMKKMETGSTLLACLPTGSGKSLLWQYAVATGKFSGTVIVIVPTNALATDHMKNDKDMFSKLPWVESIAYSSERFGSNKENMTYLCERIKDDEQLILYISPEGLTNTNIKNALIESATRKNLSAIVIDEAHLVVDWGMKFRPEFQFLPGLLSQLKERSNVSIYTILLSATYTDNDRKVLLKLFADDRVYEFRGGELRPEISFYRHHCKSEEEREKILLQLIAVVPKPAIVYVGTVANSEKYESLIKQSGFNNVARFNGDTKENERERLISQWRNNKIDIMVATSAFGMGVDKADVRTVITAYTPENISRYYQEVGRSGRDGYSALNFVLFCPIVDTGVVSNNTDKKLISTNNLWKRWKALQESASVSKMEGESNCYILDTDTKHEGLTYELTGGYNSGWNDNVVSMLARANYISILDVWRKGNADNHKSYFIKVRINDIDICFNEEKYIRKINEFREKEREEIVQGKESVINLLQKDDFGCYANTFRFVFSYPSRLCGGCPVCRKNGAPEYHEKSKMSLLAETKMEYKKKFHFRNFASVCTDSHSLSLIGTEKTLTNEELNLLVQKLIIAEANILVLDSYTNLDLNYFEWLDNNESLIITIDELNMLPDVYIGGSIVYIFSDNEESNTKMLKYIKKCTKRNKQVNQIIVADLNYYDNEEKRRLVDCVENIKLASIILGEKSIC